MKEKRKEGRKEVMGRGFGEKKRFGRYEIQKLLMS